MASVDTSPLVYIDSRLGIIVSSSILAFISTVFVALRFWSRRLTRQNFGLDEWFCLAALFCQHALLAAAGVMVYPGGLGLDIRIVATENPNNIVKLFQGLFAGEVAYTFSSPLIKLSVLTFYWRLFPTPFVRTACKILIAANIMWFIAIFILDFVQCRPLEAFWFLDLQVLPTTQCLDPTLCFLGNSIANCVIDFFTLILPLREVSKLHVSTKKKMTIGSVFILGSIAFAASLVRTISTGIMVRDGVTNFTLQFVTSGTATVVEIYAAIIGACMPTLIPVYRQLRYGDPLKSSTAASAGYSNKTPMIKGSKGSTVRRKQFGSSGSFERLSNSENPLMPDEHRNNHRVNISGHKGGALEDGGESYQMDGVLVTQNTVWSEHKQGHNAV